MTKEILELVRTGIHYGLHLVFPLFIAYHFFQKEWKKTYAILWATMLIDVDHVLAHPIFDPNRCSINFHPLHTFYAGAIYFSLLFFRKTKIWGIGLVLHLITDAIDCLWL